MIDLVYWLSLWIEEYSVPNSISLAWGQCKDDIFGRCVQLPPSKAGEGRASAIYINERLWSHPLAARATLWHEFCHAYFWIKEGRLVAHGPEWLRLFWSKPGLALFETMVTPLIWPFLRGRAYRRDN